MNDGRGRGWRLAERAAGLNPSVIREILKVTERPGVISLAGGLPSPDTFPVDAFARAAQTVLDTRPGAALQYSSSEGFRPLREFIADRLPWDVDPDLVLITTGSQQGLDLLAKVLIDQDSPVLVETPTYLGALQAFSPFGAAVAGVPTDDGGILPDRLAEHPAARDARLLYALPTFQNPTGRMLDEPRRARLVEVAADLGLPVVEDNPYGELWFDAPPPAPLAARNPDGVIYLGSFSKVLAPGLRLGFLVAPPQVYPKLLQAKQAADLHSPGFNQRIVFEVVQDGFLDRHVPTIRSLYRSRCEHMLAALAREFEGLDVTWNHPAGGMFLWLRLPDGLDAAALLPAAVDARVAEGPRPPVFATGADPRAMRLSFVTVPPEQLDTAIAALAGVVRKHLPG